MDNITNTSTAKITGPITIKEFNQYYQRLHDQLETISNYNPNQTNLDIRQLARLKLSALEKIKQDTTKIPEDSIILLERYQTSPAVGPQNLQEIDEFISQNRISAPEPKVEPKIELIPITKYILRGDIKRNRPYGLLNNQNFRNWNATGFYDYQNQGSTIIFKHKKNRRDYRSRKSF